MNNPDPILWQILLQLFLIAVNAVFACAEIAIISISDAKLEYLSSNGNKKAQRLLAFTDQPAKFLATIQVGITLAGFLGSAFAADNFSDRLVTWLISMGVNIPTNTLDTLSVILITIILSYLTLILGELVPKRIAMKKAEAIGLSMSGFVYIIAKIFAPVVWLLTVSTNGILRLFGINPNAEDEGITEAEIRLMVDAGSESGAIDPEEREFIHNVFEFDNKIVTEVMTSKENITMLWLEESDTTWKKTIHNSRYKMYPICTKSTDNIVGVLSTKDYFRLTNKTRENIMKKAVKPALFIPENIRADILFTNMKKNHFHFAIISDKNKIVKGIVSINDLLEELVGDLEEEIKEFTN
jgi:Hemolysins and related proteins containing CBS domains